MERGFKDLQRYTDLLICLELVAMNIEYILTNRDLSICRDQMEQRSILIEQNSVNSSVKWINLAHFYMIPSQTQILIPAIPFFNHYFNKKRGIMGMKIWVWVILHTLIGSWKLLYNLRHFYMISVLSYDPKLNSCIFFNS